MPDVIGFAAARLTVGEEASRLAFERETGKRRAHLSEEGILAERLATEHAIKARREGSMLPTIGGNEPRRINSATSAECVVSCFSDAKEEAGDVIQEH